MSDVATQAANHHADSIRDVIEYKGSDTTMARVRDLVKSRSLPDMCQRSFIAGFREGSNQDFHNIHQENQELHRRLALLKARFQLVECDVCQGSGLSAETAG